MKSNKLLSNALDNTVLYLKNHSATVLTCVGAVGVVVTSVLTAKATIKATEIVNEAECERKRNLSKSEIVKLTATTYIPPVLVGASTIACIFGANVFNRNQQAALMSAYALVDNSFKEYKNKLKELYGEETHNSIINSIMVEKAEEVYPYAQGFASSSSLIPDGYSGKVKLFYEPLSKRFFESTMEQVMNAEYHFNRNFVLRGLAILNELYEFLGLEATDYGEIMGWAIEDELYWIDFDHHKSQLKDGTEFYILKTEFNPSADWREYQYF